MSPDNEATRISGIVGIIYPPVNNQSSDLRFSIRERRKRKDVSPGNKRGRVTLVHIPADKRSGLERKPLVREQLEVTGILTTESDKRSGRYAIERRGVLIANEIFATDGTGRRTRLL